MADGTPRSIAPISPTGTAAASPRSANSRPPRVTLLTYGTRGDVEPFVALAARLGQAGVQVRLAAPETFRRLAGPAADFVGLPGDPRALARDLLDRAGPNIPRMVGVMVRHVREIADEAMGAIERACLGADCIVHSFLMTASGHQQAVRLGVPQISAQLFPVFSPTRDFPGPTFPDLPLGPLYRRATHTLNTLVYWQGSRILYATLRRRRAGLPTLPGYPFSGPAPVPILYAFSPLVLPRPRDWGSHTDVTGYWFLDPPPEWAPPEPLVRFLEAGEPPVYFGLGSMIGKDWEQVVDQAIRSLDQAGLRTVLASPPGAALPMPPRAFRVDDLPHAWLFPRMSAVIHHGGAGTTAAALRAGKPSVILPQTADQGFWARRLRLLGVAPAPLRRRDLSDSLGPTLVRLLGDTAMLARAEAIGSAIRLEDGVGRACAVILRLLAAE